MAVPIPKAKRGHFLAALAENFLVKPFDLHAAAIAAEIHAKAKEIPKDRRPDRAVLSADIKIIATAKAAQARVFYSNDAKCRRVAQLVMDARDLPSHSGELFS